MGCGGHRLRCPNCGSVPVGVRLWEVHLSTSDWTLTPKEVPSKVQYHIR